MKTFDDNNRIPVYYEGRQVGYQMGDVIYMTDNDAYDNIAQMINENNHKYSSFEVIHKDARQKI